MFNNDLFIENNLAEPLSKEEIYCLLRQYHEGDMYAKEQIIYHNVRLVRNEVLTKFKNVSCDKKDLMAVGLMGLINVIDNFDINYDVEFSTYAIRGIDFAIYHYIQNEAKHFNVISYDKSSKIKEHGKININNLEDIKNNIEENYVKQEVNEKVRKALETLKERDQEIVKLYYGFYDNKTFSLKTIASMYHISRTGITKILKKSLKILHDELQTQNLISDSHVFKLQRFSNK